MYNLIPQLLSPVHRYIIIVTCLPPHHHKRNPVSPTIPIGIWGKNVNVPMHILSIANSCKSSCKFTSTGKICSSRWSKFFSTEALFFQCHMILGVYVTFNVVRPMKANYLYLYLYTCILVYLYLYLYPTFTKVWLRRLLWVPWGG